MSFALRHWRLILSGVALAILLALLGFAKADARHWKVKWQELDRRAHTVLVAIQDVSTNPKLKWKDAAAQVRLVGKARDDWRGASRLQSERIAEMGRETVRLQALSAEAQRVAKRLIAKRETAIARLDRAALTPGERSDCARQMRQAEEALDAAYAAGL